MYMSVLDCPFATRGCTLTLQVCHDYTINWVQIIRESFNSNISLEIPHPEEC